MDRNNWKLPSLALACALILATSQTAPAGTIVKLSLGGDSAADIEYTGGAGGILSTADDGEDGTTGDQNTSVEFLDFLDDVATDILAAVASFTLDGLEASGPATVVGGSFLFQEFSGGTLELYDAANTLLLSGTLDESALAGPYGPPATGGLFTTSFGSFTGGTLSSYILPGSLSLSMSVSSINGNAGLTVTPPPAVIPPVLHSGLLNAFTADATVTIDGEVPEPASALLMAVGGVLAAMAARRRGGQKHWQ